MEVTASFPLPKSRRRRDEIARTGYWHTSRGDVDNLAKTVMDALNGEAYRDDAQVCALYAKKKYAQNPEDVGLFVRLYDYEGGIFSGY